jgi:hypothetical protein
VELYLVCVGVADEQELEGVGQHDATVLALVVAGLGDLDLRRRGVGLGRRRRRLGRRLGWVSARGLERKWGGSGQSGSPIWSDLVRGGCWL